MRLVIKFVLSCAVALLFATSAGGASGTFLGKTFTRVPGGDNYAYRALVQGDGKMIVVGAARFGTMQFQITRYNADGSLDTSFASGGTMFEPLGPGNAEAWGVAVQADGKIVVGGHVRSDRDRFGIARFNADGSLDLSFGGGGAATTIGPGDSGAFALAMQADGKIVLGGYSLGPSGKKVFTLARYNTDATLDASFGSGGFARTAEAAGDEVIRAIGIQGDGKIVAAGSGSNYLAMHRFTANGGLDGTWGTGAVTTILGGRDLVIQPDGKIAIVGTVPGGAISEVGVLRMTATGNPDSSFGSGTCATGACPGVASMPIAEDATGWGIALQPDGKLVVSGNTTLPAGQGVAIAIGRFNANGSVDTAFGSSGRTSVQVSGRGDTGYGLVRRADGRFLVAGSASGASGDLDSLAVAFTAAGALDTAFNGSGFSRLDAGSMTAEARASVVQTDGKVILAGTTTREQHTTAPAVIGGMLARYLPDGTIDPSFGSGGYVGFTWPASAVALQADAKIVVAGYALTNQGGANVPSMTFARYLSNGTLDTSFGTAGTLTITPTSSDEEITALAIQPDGRIVGGGLQIQGTFLDSIFVRLTTSGALDPTFNATGKSVVAMSTGSDEITAIAIQGDGKVVGAGWAEISSGQDSFGATRLNLDGTLDTAFGTNGVATINFGANTSKGYGLVVQPDGKLVIGGKVFIGTTDDFALARLLPNGTLDGAFGSGGVASNDFGNHNRIFGLARTPGGKLVGAGETGGLFSVVQYLANGTLDTTFGSGGSTSAAVNAGNDYANSISVGADGTLFVAGNGSGVFTLARFAGDAGNGAPAKDLAITQSANVNPASVGKDVIFTLVASNNGPGAATSVVVTDTLPTGSTFVWATPGCGYSSGTVSCSTASLAAGQTVSFKVVVRPGSAGSATNFASVAAADPDSNWTNNSSSLGLAVNSTPTAIAVLRYRLYSDVTKEHHFTTDENEYNVLGTYKGTWVQEGTVGKVLNNPGSFNGVTAVPYYRLYDTSTRWHHWTTDPNEYYTLIQFANWNAEGVDGYILPTNTAGATQLYRLNYPYLGSLHHWTIDANEYNTLISQYGWIGEGGAGFVIQ